MPSKSLFERVADRDWAVLRREPHDHRRAGSAEVHPLGAIVFPGALFGLAHTATERASTGRAHLNPRAIIRRNAQGDGPVVRAGFQALALPFRVFQPDR